MAKAIGILILGCALLHVSATPASAECFGETDPWPSFRAAVATAERIVAGEVLPPESASDSTGFRDVFKLRVIDVLRGPALAGGVLEIVGIRSGLPLTICASSTATLLSGDVVVFALGAMDSDGVTRINTLAYLREPAESVLSDVERITPSELYAIAPPPVPPNDSLLPTLLTALGGLLIVALGGLLLRRRARSDR